MAGEFTPWQRMKAYADTVKKIENNWRIKVRNEKEKSGVSSDDPNVIVAEPFVTLKDTLLTYYNNGKTNFCGKERYDYNYFHCDGYDQYRHREDRKHPFLYMNIDLEEEYPCRTVPLLTNSTYGSRPPIDTLERKPRSHYIKTFFRNRGAGYCIKATGYQDLRLQPTTALKWNAQFGYTYSPPRN